MTIPPPPPPPPGYGYGEPPPGYSGGGSHADWGPRVVSALVDWAGPFIVAGVIYFVSRPLGSIAYLAALAWAIYQAYLGGRPDSPRARRWPAPVVVLEATGQPIGGAMGIGRYFLHILDSIPCYVGYLWPLWDAKKQTFADKIVKTIVVKV